MLLISISVINHTNIIRQMSIHLFEVGFTSLKAPSDIYLRNMMPSLTDPITDSFNGLVSILEVQIEDINLKTFFLPNPNTLSLPQAAQCGLKSKRLSLSDVLLKGFEH